MVARADPGPPEQGAGRDDEDDIGLGLPPSRASTAGSASEGSDTDGYYVAQRGDQGGRRGRREHVHPELVDGLCDHEDRMVVDDLVLLDPSELRREVVGGLSERILRDRGWGGTFSTTADPHAALEGADFVVVQLRIGGQAARHVDETLPVGYGCLGQETTGAGGLAKALRTVPMVLELAEETAARANPGPGSSTSPTRWAS